jgi:enoyl-[acyl-carrier protein] reductase II
MFEGDLEEGELEIGQVSALIHNIKPAAKILQDMVAEFEEAKRRISKSPI